MLYASQSHRDGKDRKKSHASHSQGDKTHYMHICQDKQ